MEILVRTCILNEKYQLEAKEAVGARSMSHFLCWPCRHVAGGIKGLQKKKETDFDLIVQHCFWRVESFAHV